MDKKELNPFEQNVWKTLKEIHTYNEKHSLFKSFPKREIPLVIDCKDSKIKSGWTAVYSGLRNKIVLSHELSGEDLTLTLIHELKHAEQWFNDSNLNNYQKHQAYCLYEVLAKLFVGQFLGRGAYFNISLTEALYKWFSKHYPNYKEKYDKQWSITKNDNGLKHLPKSFGISEKEEAKIIEILNKKVIKENKKKMIKQSGQKNPLTKEEKEYYESSLHGDYSIGKQLGISGQGTSTYLLTDKQGQHFVLKVPNDSEKCTDWLKGQEYAEKLRNQYIGEYQGAIHIPKIIQKGKDFIIEELAVGGEFLEGVYDKLTLSQKKTSYQRVC